MAFATSTISQVLPLVSLKGFSCGSHLIVDHWLHGDLLCQIGKEATREAHDLPRVPPSRPSRGSRS